MPDIHIRLFRLQFPAVGGPLSTNAASNQRQQPANKIFSHGCNINTSILIAYPLISRQ
jgi:hypothetical protein